MIAKFALRFCLLSIAVISFIGALYAETDTAYWNEESIQGAITDRLSVSIELKYRFKDDAKQHYYTSSGIELNYEFLPWFEAGFGYREIFRQKKTAWQQENRPYAVAAEMWKVGEWKFKNRTKVELREKDAGEGYYRFRDKLTIKTPWKWTSAEINPYVADEVFLEKKERAGFNENRAYAGVGLKLHEHLGLDVYYMYNIEAEDREWTERTDVIGTELTFSF